METWLTGGRRKREKTGVHRGEGREERDGGERRAEGSRGGGAPRERGWGGRAGLRSWVLAGRG